MKVIYFVMFVSQWIVIVYSWNAAMEEFVYNVPLIFGIPPGNVIYVEKKLSMS